jgi:hypothetical protein
VWVCAKVDYLPPCFRCLPSRLIDFMRRMHSAAREGVRKGFRECVSILQGCTLRTGAYRSIVLACAHSSTVLACAHSSTVLACAHDCVRHKPQSYRATGHQLAGVIQGAVLVPCPRSLYGSRGPCLSLICSLPFLLKVLLLAELQSHCCRVLEGLVARG